MEISTLKKLKSRQKNREERLCPPEKKFLLRPWAEGSTNAAGSRRADSGESVGIYVVLISSVG